MIAVAFESTILLKNKDAPKHLTTIKRFGYSTGLLFSLVPYKI